MTIADDAFVFSYGPDHQRHCDPDATTHRYSRMTAALGIDTHLHALRHYSATELIAADAHLCHASPAHYAHQSPDWFSGLRISAPSSASPTGSRTPECRRSPGCPGSPRRHQPRRTHQWHRLTS